MEALLPRTEAILEEQEVVLATLVNEELDRLQGRLRNRLLQARSLSARNYDAALRASPAGVSP